MSKKWKKPGSAEKRPDGDPTPTDHCKYEPRSVYPVRIEPTTEENEWKTDQKKNWGRQIHYAKWLNRITAIAAAGAFLYAFIAYLQWNDAHHNFRVDQRAWLKISLTDTSKITLQENVIYTVPMRLDNVGKSAASNIHWDVRIEKVKNGNDPQFTYDVHHFSMAMGVIFPNDPTDETVPMTEPAVGVPTKGKIMSHDDIQELLKGDAYMAIYSFVDYKDVFGREHTTRFCSYSAPKQALPHDYTARKCTDYNRVDNN